jgi:diguanylate cyclase (GGDEF)-like protein
MCALRSSSSSAVSDASADSPAEQLDAQIDDILVFEYGDRGFTLAGGEGRGAGWAGIVELDAADAALVGRSWRRGTAERSDSADPVQIAGPYYARHAVAVPVGERHVVVFGSGQAITVRESELISRAAAAVDGAKGASAGKLLADELEVVQALRSLTAYQPLTVRDTARHIATVAAQALSCEVAVIRVDLADEPLVEGLDLRSMTPLAMPDRAGHLGTIHPGDLPRIEQVALPDPDIFGVDVASRLTLPLGGPRTGALALGHATARARGFTSLCQRIGRAIADASELLIDQARAREQLSRERDLLTRMVNTDPLTGVANRNAWNDAVASWNGVSGREAFVVSCDLDDLKGVNDAFGHTAGDALIRGAASLIRTCVRDSDLIARVGGDEFIVLLSPADQATADRVLARLRRAERMWRVTEHGLVPRLSMGLAPVVDGDLESARSIADRAMYANKRRRRARSSVHKARADRRSASGTRSVQSSRRPD